MIFFCWTSPLSLQKKTNMFHDRMRFYMRFSKWKSYFGLHGTGKEGSRSRGSLRSCRTKTHQSPKCEQDRSRTSLSAGRIGTFRLDVHRKGRPRSWIRGTVGSYEGTSCGPETMVQWLYSELHPPVKWVSDYPKKGVNLSPDEMGFFSQSKYVNPVWNPTNFFRFFFFYGGECTYKKPSSRERRR